jgi:hypothetical protein
MNVQMLTNEQIRRNGLAALARELGTVGMVRFLQQFETGQGDYSTDRHQWLGDESVAAIAEKLQSRRSDGSGAERDED